MALSVPVQKYTGDSQKREKTLVPVQKLDRD